MPLEIIRNDITQVHADAIVNAAAPSLLGGGGVDGAIHRAAGPGLLEECRTLGGCEAGRAVITGAYNLPARHVIHTVGPVWQGGGKGEEALLADCYRSALELARQRHLESVAFPLIASGAFGYPRDKALGTAISVIGEFLLAHDMTVYLVVYDRASFQLSERLFASIRQYVDDRYVEERRIGSRERNRSVRDRYPDYPEEPMPILSERVSFEEPRRSLDDVLDHLEETFSQRLLRLIDERGMTDAETYKKANIDRRLFSKIRNDVHYRPGKPTALAFAVALELNLDETRDLLSKAGFALSGSFKFDLIVQYFIETGNYNIFEINEALFAFDQSLLGS